jgi:hypothetical protein
VQYFALERIINIHMPFPKMGKDPVSTVVMEEKGSGCRMSFEVVVAQDFLVINKLCVPNLCV